VNLHFISGLPRSGSTLLSALLRQNPRFHASMSSPMASLINALQREMSQGNEYAIFIDDEQRAKILTACFDAYYHHIPPMHVVFDTSRGWTVKLTMLAQLFPQAKMICCVRNVAWVLDSIESVVRRNCLQPSKIFAYDPAGTVYSRVEGLVSNTGMVGASLFGLREAVFSEQADRLLLVQFETLTTDPLGTLAKIYDFIGETPFCHDPDHIEPCLEAAEFDARIGTHGLHGVGSSVRPIRRRTILPGELFTRYEVFSFWQKPNEMPPGIRLV
jgi:sulfotransferase